MKLAILYPALALMLLIALSSCSSGPEADMLGIGAQCSSADDCLEDQVCLTQFKGGYCGLVGCQGNVDCPEFSSCVSHSDGANYCFRDCVDKGECNYNRNPDQESNCSASVTFVDNVRGIKACVPPSG